MEAARAQSDRTSWQKSRRYYAHFVGPVLPTPIGGGITTYGEVPGLTTHHPSLRILAISRKTALKREGRKPDGRQRVRTLRHLARHCRAHPNTSKRESKESDTQSDPYYRPPRGQFRMSLVDCFPLLHLIGHRLLRFSSPQSGPVLVPVAGTPAMNHGCTRSVVDFPAVHNRATGKSLSPRNLP